MLKRTWLVPAVVAGLVAVGVTGAAVAAGMFGDGGPEVVGSGAGPAGVGPAPATSAPPAATSAAAAPTTSSSAPPTGQRFTLGPVSFAVPTGWHQLTRLSREGVTQSCLAPVGASPCEVDVMSLDTPGRAASDRMGSLSVLELSPCHSSAGVPNMPHTTVASSQVVIDGVPAEYRAESTGCGAVKMRWEQWTVPTAPAFQILSHTSDLRTADVIHELIQRTIRVSRHSQTRVFDLGYLVGHQGYLLRFDRVTLRIVDSQPRVENNNTQTRTYRVSPAAKVTDYLGGRLCGTSEQYSTCSVDTMVKHLPYTAAPVQLGMDASGQVVAISAVGLD
jgi:hypothetical protein